jgi:hypothetical protein
VQGAVRSSETGEITRDVTKTSKKILVPVLAGIILVAPQAMELACNRMEAHEFSSSFNCENNSKALRAPFRDSCGKLVDRSFPPHSHSDNLGEADTYSISSPNAASGTVDMRILPITSLIDPENL